MSEITQATVLADMTDDAVDKLFVLSVEDGSVELVEADNTALTEATNIYRLTTPTDEMVVRHRTDSLERLEWLVETGEMKVLGTSSTVGETLEVVGV